MAGRAEPYCRNTFNPILNGTDAWMHNNLDGKDEGERGPDYFLALAGIQIEVKNTNRDGALIDTVSPMEEKFLNMYGGYIYLVMWDKDYPRLPNGADAYLIPWIEYRDWIPTVPRMKSIRRHKTSRGVGVDEVFPQYKMEWTNKYEGKYRFTIPSNHPIWNDIRQRIIDFKIKFDKFIGSLEEI